ncbi:LAMI_0F03840g1_1 [Lachancea mirantina]|uniref:LAMI_0F03840g1_1 n=1 Tax=Lachancea mirantina TaxID=1230905 RepID=A0A1G4JXH4_9SACH|nr:LAMI_0F03840g1_1 [Lachancea mirantina]
MPQSYDYDEKAETWPFFAMAVLVVVLLPLTLMQIYELFNSQKEEKFGEQTSTLNELNQVLVPQSIKKFRAKYKVKKSGVWSKKTLIVCLGWCLVAVIWKTIDSNEAVREAASTIFDPYLLLDISTSATEKEIRSAYRKLSIKFHPDKVAKNLSEQQRAVLEEQYVLITKAYKALTDEVTRENYLQYGHPDGPQATSHGIALPRFLVESSASPFVVVGYIALLGLILPIFVSRWWSRTQSVTKKGIHVKTASYFADRLFNFKPSQVVTSDLILDWLSNAEEYKIMYPHLGPKVFRNLLNDHLQRASNGEDLNEIKLRVVAKTHSLLFGLLDVSTNFRNTEISLAAIDTFKSIVQATPVSPESQIFQLPNVDQKRFSEGSVDDVRTLGKLFTYDEKKIGQILGISDESRLQETLKVASFIPRLKLLKAEFKVPGETVVTPESIPHIALKVLVVSPKHKAFPPSKFPQVFFEEEQDFEAQKDPFASALEQPPVPQTFAPLFPVERTGGWCALVMLQKDGKVIQTPLVVDRLSFSNLDNDFDKREIKDVEASFKPENWVVGTIKIPFSQPAPPQNGDYFFRVVLKSTEYFGSDLDFTLPMMVRDPPSEADSDKQYDDDSESDSDGEGDDDEDEDDLDEENDSDYTDIDTDTDGEEEKSLVN